MSRDVPGVVDHDVPAAAALERAQSVVDSRIPVADELLDLVAEQSRVAATVEHRDLVAAGKRVLDLVRADETRPAEKQDRQPVFRGQ